MLMDHNMVLSLSYDYSSQNRRRQRTNVPLSQAISMDIAVRLCDTEHIAQFSMIRSSPKATGRRWRLLALYCPGGRQGDNQHNDNATCTHFAGHFDGQRDAAVQYRAHHLMDEVRGFYKSH